jgi:hypothetical protein
MTKISSNETNEDDDLNAIIQENSETSIKDFLMMIQDMSERNMEDGKFPVITFLHRAFTQHAIVDTSWAIKIVKIEESPLGKAN